MSGGTGLLLSEVGTQRLRDGDGRSSDLASGSSHGDSQLPVAVAAVAAEPVVAHAYGVCQPEVPVVVPAGTLQVEPVSLTPAAIEADLSIAWRLVLKRAIDVFVSLAALAVLSPLFLLMALLIKATGAGPVFFGQRRVGMHGQVFRMLKFRSMVINAEELRPHLEVLNESNGPVFKMRLDPRVTWIGRFMRKYSMDELPQLINVLFGDMSLVGPRPPLPSEVARYQPWQHRRFAVRPGLTCFWQVSHGRYRISFDEWIRLDLKYIDQWTLLVDLCLIFRTVGVVLRGTGE
jgi:lipopolysaccharide/colanic/teichoic acid biosynthesis glycosyltransferase